MEQRREMTSPAQVRCIVHPLRSSILMLFAADVPLSVQRMAEKLELPHGKVYYHVRKLVDHGFLEEVRRSTINGIEERFYLPAASSFVLSAELAKSPGLRASLSSAADDVFDHVVGEVRKSILGRSWSFQVSEGYFTDEECHAIGEEIAQLFKRYQKPRPGAVLTSFTGFMVSDRPPCGPKEDVGVTTK